MEHDLWLVLKDFDGRLGKIEQKLDMILVKEYPELVKKDEPSREEEVKKE